MIDLGKVKPGSTLRIPFGTYDGGTGASLVMTAYVAADIEVYKDGSTTQRASDAGFVATTTFDTITGIHVCEIDLADNTTANFFEAGSEYWVIIGPVTIDAQTVNFPIARFIIGYEGAILDTTIATLASQTSFTLEEGPAEDDALNNHTILVHDLASAVQIAVGYVLDYTGSTRTVTLAADPGIFTMAVGDNASFFPPVNVAAVGTTLQTAGDVIGDTNDIQSRLPAALVSGRMDSSVGAMAANVLTVTAIANDAITAAKIAADAIGASELATDAVEEIADQVWNELMSGHLTLGSFGQAFNGLASRTGAVNDAGPTTSDFDTDGFTEASNNHFNGSVMVFTSGALLGQHRVISTYTGAGQNCAFDRAWSEAPATNDEFIILGPSAGVLTRVIATQSDGMAQADLREWLGAAPNALNSGTVQADVQRWLNGVVNALIAGRVDANTQAMAAAVITASIFGADAVDANALATDAVNEIARAVNPQQNLAFSNIEFEMYDSTTHNPSAGLTVTGERSIDGGAYVGVSGAIVGVGSGTYQFDALAADMNGAFITFKFSEATADDTFVHVKTAA